MNKAEVAFRALDMIGYACGIPQITMFTKLFEELIDSQREMLIKLEKSRNLDQGELLGLIGSGETALENYFNGEMAEDFRVRQLRRAWSKFNQAYYTLKLRPAFVRNCPKVAKSLALCHFLMGHRDAARTWVQKAIDDNRAYDYPENHQALLDLLKELADEKYLPEGQ